MQLPTRHPRLEGQDSMQRPGHDQWKSTEVARLLALVESERRYYQDIFAVLPLPVALVDPAWNLSAVNREFRRRFALEHSDLSRLRLPELFPDPALEAALAEVLSTGQPQDWLSTAPPVRVSILRMPGWQAGSEDELLLIFQPAGPADAAPAHRVERETIEDAKRGAVERLSARLAHVANNLLMIIGGYSEELLLSLPEPDPRRDDVQQIINASQRLGALTRDLTTLTRPPAYDVGDFPLAAFLRTMATRLASDGLVCGEAPADLRAQTAPVLLGQIIFEAVRYIKPHAAGAPLKLEARPSGADQVEITLSFNPSALNDDARERFFEPFAGEKLGADPPLGLAGLVAPWRSLGGLIFLDDDRLALTCPRAVAPPEPEFAATVLLVEDEPGIRSLIVKALERSRYRVVECGSPAEALAALSAMQSSGARPDVLVTDLMVPGMTGRELSERVRATLPSIPVLFISGYTSDDELAARIASGDLPPASRFLPKPFTVAQLLEQVKALLASGR
ncbi:MAG: response regulator [Candidatus Solibacter usitatus]|nr:response regulator [Candidatus Solibacter usitatus]